MVRMAFGLGLAVPLLAAVVIGCGGSDSGSGGSGNTGTGGNATGATGGGGSQDVPCDGAPADLALDGTWAAYGDLAVKLQGLPGGAITICPEDQVGEATMVLLLTIKQDPADALKLSEVKATLCSIELPAVTALVGSCDPMSQSLVTTQITAPQALIDALPNIGTATVGGTLDGKQKGAGLSLDRFTVTVGTSKNGDMMPTWDTETPACNSVNVGRTNVCEVMCVDDCAGMTDDDSDGYPGVTLQVCGFTESDQQSSVPCHADMPNDPGATLQGKAFVDIEVDPQCTGIAKSSCELIGNIDTGVLYNLVGGDVYLAGSPITVTSAIKSLPVFDVDTEASKFRMVRIDGLYGAPNFEVDPTQASASCKTIMMRLNELF